jgi:EAL domain-containing protein (putative c-di-GMP-specific phosphodiesterase class I)
VLSLAVKELAAHPELRLAVNVSGMTAAQTSWPEHIQRILAGRTDITRRLIIEITETAAVTDVTETERFANFLQRLGGQVALDDFGAGTTSIRHLRTLALAIMKIDRELFINLIGNKEQEHLVRMLISIAHGFGLKVVAEGVETSAVADWLREARVDMMQGYYFGRPELGRPWVDLATQGLIAGKAAKDEVPLELGAVTVLQQA